MAKKVKKEKPKKGFNIFDEDETAATSSEEELPKDEAGRRKIKRQYEDLLGIRIQKLRGRILNRERINKTIEGIIEGRPVILVHDGKIDHLSLRKVQMTTHELEAALRAAGCAGPAGVRFAVLENTGKVSVILREGTDESFVKPS